MSRIGNKPISVQNNIKVDIQGKQVSVTGSLGTLTHTVPDEIDIENSDGQIIVKRPNDNRRSKSLHGLTRTLLANMLHGVEKGFQKDLEIQGVGYRAQSNGDKLSLNLGYSHPVEYKVPADIKVSVTENTKITVSGSDKQKVGQIAATIRKFRPPEPYKGKGIRYVGEYILMKEGKTV